MPAFFTLKSLLFLLRQRINAYLQSCPVFPLKIHHTVDQSKESVIRPPSNIRPRMEFCTPLPDQDVACTDNLSTKSLDTEALRLAVPAVS